MLTASRIAIYTLTDVSASLFEKAKDKFKNHQDIMEYKVLDVEKDVFEQALGLGTYHFVVAQSVIHATSDLQSSLSIARKLLKQAAAWYS